MIDREGGEIANLRAQNKAELLGLGYSALYLRKNVNLVTQHRSAII